MNDRRKDPDLLETETGTGIVMSCYELLFSIKESDQSQFLFGRRRVNTYSRVLVKL